MPLTITLAEARLKEADAIDKSTRVTQQAIDNLRLFGTEAGRAGERGHGAGERVAAGWKSAAGAIGSASQALQDYQQRMQDKYGRPGEGEKGLFEDGRKSTRGEELGKGVEEIGSGGYQFRNKDGMTSDAKGNVQQQFVWTRTSIIDYLTQAGLDELLAEQLSKQFLNGQGGVNYEAGDAQKRWGGKYSTLAEALGKMAEYYKYDDSGKHEAAQMLDYERSKNSSAPTAAAAPSGTRSGGTSSGVTGGATSYVSNITIDGQRTSVNFADRGSQQATEQLLRQLAQARGASI